MPPPERRGVAEKSNEALQELGPQIQWLESYITKDKIYCVYIAPSKDLILKHALTHEVVYGGVLQNRRKLLHRNVGIALEELYPDQFRQMFFCPAIPLLTGGGLGSGGQVAYEVLTTARIMEAPPT